MLHQKAQNMFHAPGMRFQATKCCSRPCHVFHMVKSCSCTSQGVSANSCSGPVHLHRRTADESRPSSLLGTCNPRIETLQLQTCVTVANLI